MPLQSDALLLFMPHLIKMEGAKFTAFDVLFPAALRSAAQTHLACHSSTTNRPTDARRAGSDCWRLVPR